MKHFFLSVALMSTMLGLGQALGNLNYQTEAEIA